MDGPTITTFFSVLVVLLGGVSLLLYGNQKTLRDSNSDLEKRVAFLEAKSSRDDKTIEKQEAAIEVLRQSMTGEVHLVAISDMAEHISRDLNKHHQEAVGQWGGVTNTLADISATMVAMRLSLEHLERRTRS